MEHMNIFDKIVEWLTKDQVFSWFDGNGFAFIFCCATLIGACAITFNKKLRNIFF